MKQTIRILIQFIGKSRNIVSIISAHTYIQMESIIHRTFRPSCSVSDFAFLVFLGFCDRASRSHLLASICVLGLVHGLCFHVRSFLDGNISHTHTRDHPPAVLRLKRVYLGFGAIRSDLVTFFLRCNPECFEVKQVFRIGAVLVMSAWGT